MELELKHLAPYLPYRLKCQYFGIVDVLKYDKHLLGDQLFCTDEESGFGLKIGELKEIKIYKKYWTAHVGVHPGHLKSFINGYSFKPILRPLDLNKEIEVGGKRFVPVKEFTILYGGGLTESGKPLWESDFVTNIQYSYYGALSYNVVEKLFSWHFDVFSLIDKGLALDYNQINM